MARRFRQYAGLLSRLLLVATLCFLSAARDVQAESGPEEPLKVILTRAPDSPAVGGSLVITLFVDHPKPAEVSVEAPVFPPSLVVERTRIEPKSFPGTSGKDERWTAVEYSFRISAAGEHRIGQFIVQACGKTARTPPLSITVGGGSPVVPRKSLSWEDVPDAALVGVPFDIRLVAVGFTADVSMSVVVDTPENSILQKSPVSQAETRSGTIARFRLTLLDSMPFRLPAVTLHFPDGSSASAPSLGIPVSRASSPSDSQVAAFSASRPSLKTEKAKRLPFPDSAALSVPSLFRRSIAPVLESARVFWEKGDYVSAMTALRAAERDSSFGLFVRPTRREAEKLLLLPLSRDEPFAPFVALVSLVVSAALIALLVGLSLLLELFKLRPVTSVRHRRFMVIYIALAVGSLASARLLYAGAKARESVVLTSCRSLRVPDPVSARSADFSMGQAARTTTWTGKGEGAWLFVELDDGRSGWIEAVHARRY
ncbi:MAG: hypothetical protein WCT14_21535 [Treponemataceae bacterium]